MFGFIINIFLQIKLIVLALCGQPQKVPQPSTLYKLPPEVRMKIYPHVLALNYNNQPPALLLALGKEYILYSEACFVYLGINAVVDRNNREAFKARPSMQEIKHLMLVCNPSRERNLYLHDDHVLLRANTLLLHNNLTTITFDDSYCSAENPTGAFDIGIFDTLRQLARASSSGVTRISMRLQGTSRSIVFASDLLKRREAVQWFNLSLGIVGKQEVVPPGMDFEGWVWEREDGGSLNVKGWVL